MNITQYSCTHIFIKVKFQETQRLKSCILSILSIHLRLKPNYRKKSNRFLSKIWVYVWYFSYTHRCIYFLLACKEYALCKILERASRKELGKRWTDTRYKHSISWLKTWLLIWSRLHFTTYLLSDELQVFDLILSKIHEN